jgi:hypothetical protein
MGTFPSPCCPMALLAFGLEEMRARGHELTWLETNDNPVVSKYLQSVLTKSLNYCLVGTNLRLDHM